MKMTVTLILLPLLALTTFTAPVVRAQGGERTTFQQVQKVFASDNEYERRFRPRLRSVAGWLDDGRRRLPRRIRAGSSAGAAYVYTRAVPSGNWTEVAKLMASDKQAGDYFGWSVSTSADGSTVVVGAPFEDTGGQWAGAAYVFTRGGAGGSTSYTEVAKVQASDKQARDLFGWSVSTSADGSTVFVGAPDEDTGGSMAGAAYVFTRGGGGGSGSYTEVAKLQASDKQANDYFGISVSTSADGSTVTQVAKLQASDKQAGDYFGWSVSTSADGSTVVVGAPEEDTGGQWAGAAYVFTRGGGGGSGSYTEVAKLQASDKQARDLFGWSVSTSADGSTVVVGAYAHYYNAMGGATYVFTRGGGASGGSSYTQVAKLQASDKQAYDRLRLLGISFQRRTNDRRRRA
ncbi:FG-GAP repeat protein [Pycnococcus provasolii]